MVAINNEKPHPITSRKCSQDISKTLEGLKKDTCQNLLKNVLESLETCFSQLLQFFAMGQIFNIAWPKHSGLSPAKRILEAQRSTSVGRPTGMGQRAQLDTCGSWNGGQNDEMGPGSIQSMSGARWSHFGSKLHDPAMWRPLLHSLVIYRHARRHLEKQLEMTLWRA